MASRRAAFTKTEMTRAFRAALEVDPNATLELVRDGTALRMRPGDAIDQTTMPNGSHSKLLPEPWDDED